eukprot:1362962-Prymnesium_polylepis.2
MDGRHPEFANPPDPYAMVGFDELWAFVKPNFRVCFRWVEGEVLNVATMQSLARAVVHAHAATYHTGRSVTRECLAAIKETVQLSVGGIPTHAGCERAEAGGVPLLQRDVRARWAQLKPWCQVWQNLFSLFLTADDQVLEYTVYAFSRAVVARLQPLRCANAGLIVLSPRGLSPVEQVSERK